MDNANACSRKDWVSTSSKDTKENEERMVSTDQETSDGPKSDQRSSVQALHTQLQRLAAKPSMDKRRKARAKAKTWDALATRLRRVKKVTFQGGYGDNTFDISIQDKVGNLKTTHFGEV